MGNMEKIGETKGRGPPDIRGDFPRATFDCAVFDFCADFSIINMLALVGLSASRSLS